MRAAPLPVEPATNPGRRTPSRLNAAIVAALADGPLMKWKLRDRLHEPEAVVFKALKRLRDAGTLKVVGKRSSERRWALAAWQPPATIGESFATVVHKKPVAPTDSWWTRPMADRAAFTTAHATREREAGWSGGREVRPSMTTRRRR